MQKKTVKTGKGVSVLNILIVVLSIILAVSILVTISVFREETSAIYDSENSLYYTLRDEEYHSLARRYYDNAAGREDDPRVKDLAEYYAVGRYFEKAFFANAFMKAGDSEKEAMYRRQMDALEPEMGEFAGEKEKILALFPDL